MYYHHIGTPQSYDVLVWRGEGKDASSLITGRPTICSWDQRGAKGARRWLFWNIYRNTNPETECFMIELPRDLEVIHGDQVGHELARMLPEAKWISRGFRGDLHCE